MKNEIEVQTYFSTEDGIVYLNRKIGNQDWEKIETPYDKEPIVFVNWFDKEELNEN